MKNSKLIFALLVVVLTQSLALSQEKDPKVILITLDGLRWQELFGGADSALIANKEFVEDVNELEELFAAKTKKERREMLMPFMWNTVAKEGVIYGNRYGKSKVELRNNMHFSYPGYNEILTGFADDKNIRSNDKVYNQNVTILEKLDNHDDFKGKVYAFASWDVFPFIINTERSSVPVNAGYCHSLSENPTDKEKFLDKIQDETPKRWGSVRFDVFTHNYALENLKNKHPKVVYIGYGETDDYAHDGRYDHYLKSAKTTDQMIQEIWELVQSDPFYKDQTTLVITTDHGRGLSPDSGPQSWRHHGEKYKDSEFTWLAMIGNQIPAFGESNKDEIYFTNQIANTIAEILNFTTHDDRMGKSMLPHED